MLTNTKTNAHFTKQSSAFFVSLVSRYYIHWLKCPGFVSSVRSGLGHIPHTLSGVPLPELLWVRERPWKGCTWNLLLMFN